jgi:hypothetical protein
MEDCDFNEWLGDEYCQASGGGSDTCVEELPGPDDYWSCGYCRCNIPYADGEPVTMC